LISRVFCPIDKSTISWDTTQPECILLLAGGGNEISVCATGEKQSDKRHYREEQRFYCPNFADVEEQKPRSHNHPFLEKSLEAKYHLDLPISTVNRSSDTNRVGPVSLAQWTGCDFLFSPLEYGNTHFGEPVDAKLVPAAPMF
jgi:hypothetical protein